MNEQRMKPRAEVDIQPGNYYWAQRDHHDCAPTIVWLSRSLASDLGFVTEHGTDHLSHVEEFEFWSDPIPRMEPYKP